jgi:hypothetical protein
MSKELVPRPVPPASRRDRGPLGVAFSATRFAAEAWFRTATWSVGVSVRVARSWRDPQAAATFARDLLETLRGLGQELLQVSDMSLDQRIRRLLPPTAAPVADNGRAADPADLRERATELLRQAAEVGPDDAAHPAFARILLELAPDEARILRLLASEGPQPAVDVRAIGVIRSGEVVATGLNMVGAAAGVRHPERVPVYLDNLGRLGLIRFSPKPLEDAIAYQVLEAQPHVLSAVRETNRARTVQRSVRLTPFGREFCQVCLPLEAQEPAAPRPG